VHYRTGDVGHDRLVKIVFASSKLAVEFPTDLSVVNDAPIATAAERP